MTRFVVDCGVVLRLAGEEITRLPAHEIVTRGVGQSPEGRRIFPRMTVLENLEMGAFHRTDRDGIAADLARVLGLFPRLKERLNQKGGTLSGGEQQRVAIARALINEPMLLLADEPTGNLDPDMAQEIMSLFQEVNARGTTVLVATHDRDMIQRMGKRVIALDRGRVVAG